RLSMSSISDSTVVKFGTGLLSSSTNCGILHDLSRWNRTRFRSSRWASDAVNLSLCASNEASNDRPTFIVPSPRAPLIPPRSPPAPESRSGRGLLFYAPCRSTTMIWNMSASFLGLFDKFLGQVVSHLVEASVQDVVQVLQVSLAGTTLTGRPCHHGGDNEVAE